MAADESQPTITKRFNALGIESTEDTRRRYRSLLFGTPRAEDYLSGVIMFEETLAARRRRYAVAELLMQRGRSAPWGLSISYVRALQDPAMRAWGGRVENVAAAQRGFHHRIRMNALNG